MKHNSLRKNKRSNARANYTLERALKEERRLLEKYGKENDEMFIKMNSKRNANFERYFNEEFKAFKRNLKQISSMVNTNSSVNTSHDLIEYITQALTNNLTVRRASTSPSMTKNNFRLSNSQIANELLKVLSVGYHNL
jgi:hypothetical protein